VCTGGVVARALDLRLKDCVIPVPLSADNLG